MMKWVHDAAVDLIRSNARRRDRNENWQANTVSPFAKTEDPDKDAYAQAVWEALNQLPEEQRSVVHLRLWEGYTFETIASTLNISINTAGSRFRYGIDKMRERRRPLYEELKDYHGCL
jgi:RNA polymerase sigma-70 factor (ECF subfamily)